MYGESIDYLKCEMLIGGKSGASRRFFTLMVELLLFVVELLLLIGESALLVVELSPIILESVPIVVEPHILVVELSPTHLTHEATAHKKPR